MIVASTELKTNLGKYLDLLDTEEIIITRNGRKYAKLVREEDDSLSEIRSLFGILADTKFSNMSDEDITNVIREERGIRYERVD